MTKKKENPKRQWKMADQRQWEKNMSQGLMAIAIIGLILALVAVSVGIYCFISLVDIFQEADSMR